MTSNLTDGYTSEVIARPAHAMLPAHPGAAVHFPAESKPRLLVVIDAEEEFDWKKPFSRANTQISTIAAQGTADRIFSEFGITPTYVVDYPVASQETGYKPLRELLQSGRCEIGAQLHTWVTPPHEEDVTEANSYANNLAPDLERRKIVELTRVIETNFGRRPVIYRAGRYGAGSATPEILDDLGYEIDCSVLPGLFGRPDAPDYSGAIAQPYWLSTKRPVLEIPVTIGTVGLAGKNGGSLYKKIASPAGLRWKIPAIAARLGVVEQIRLSPEGYTLEECRRLTRAMFRGGARTFVISYHSPSLEIGHTPYVRSRADLEKLLAWLRGYFDFFVTEIGGIPSTMSEIRRLAIELSGIRSDP